MELKFKPKKSKDVYSAKCVCQCVNSYASSPGMRKIH